VKAIKLQFWKDLYRFSTDLEFYKMLLFRI